MRNRHPERRPHDPRCSGPPSLRLCRRCRESRPRCLRLRRACPDHYRLSTRSRLPRPTEHSSAYAIQTQNEAYPPTQPARSSPSTLLSGRWGMSGVSRSTRLVTGDLACSQISPAQAASAASTAVGGAQRPGRRRARWQNQGSPREGVIVIMIVNLAALGDRDREPRCARGSWTGCAGFRDRDRSPFTSPAKPVHPSRNSPAFTITSTSPRLGHRSFCNQAASRQPTR